MGSPTCIVYRGSVDYGSLWHGTMRGPEGGILGSIAG